MPIDDDKVFDVSKPHKVSPSATSRPIIVGHHPMMADPMVRDDTAAAVTHHTSSHQPLAAAPDGDILPTPASVVVKPPITVAQPAASFEAIQPAAAQNASLAPEPTVTSIDGLLGDDVIGRATPATAPHPNIEHSSDNTPLIIPLSHSHHRHKGRKTLLLLLLLAVIAGAYLAIDAKLIETSITLPFHVFKQ